MFISLTIVRCNIANVNLIWAPRLRLDYMHIARGPCSMQTPPRFECATKSYVRVCLSGWPFGTGPPAAAAHVYLAGRDLGLGSAALKAPAGLHPKK